jgi:hypothetical protein
MEDGEIIEGPAMIPNTQMPVPAYQPPRHRVYQRFQQRPPPPVPLSQYQQLSRSVRHENFRVNSPRGRPNIRPPSMLTQTNVVGRNLTPKEIRLMAMQNIKVGNGSLLQRQQTKYSSSSSNVNAGRNFHSSMNNKKGNIQMNSNTLLVPSLIIPNSQINKVDVPRRNGAYTPIVSNSPFSSKRPLLVCNSNNADSDMNKHIRVNSVYGRGYSDATKAAQVHVTGVTSRITKAELMNHFQRFGRVVNIHQTNGYCVIQYASRLNAQSCLGKGLRHKISGSIVSLSATNSLPNNDSSNSIRPFSSEIPALMPKKIVATDVPAIHHHGNNHTGQISKKPVSYSQSIQGDNVSVNNKKRSRQRKDPRLEDDDDDDNNGCDTTASDDISNTNKRKRVHAPIRHHDRSKQIAMLKKRYQSSIVAGHHIDDCVRDSMSLSTRYNGLVVPEEFIEMESNWVYTFPVNIGEHIVTPSQKKTETSNKNEKHNMMMMSSSVSVATATVTAATTTSQSSNTNAVYENKDNEDKKESGNYLKCNLMKKNPFIICEWLHQADYKVTKNSKQHKLKLSSLGTKVMDQISVDPATGNRVIYNAHVILHTMETDRMKVQKVLPKDQLEMPSFKLLLAKLSNGIYSLPGGAWSKSLDKGDPCIDDRSLIETCIRCTKYQSGIDLALCTEWVKVSQFYYRTYDKSGVLEVRTVVLLPNVSDLIPSRNLWGEIREYILKDSGGINSLKETNPKVKKWVEERGQWHVALSKKKIYRLDLDGLREELRMRSLSTVGDESSLKLRLFRATKNTNNFKVHLPRESSIIVGRPHDELELDFRVYGNDAKEGDDLNKLSVQWVGFEFLSLKEISLHCKNSFFSSLNSNHSQKMSRQAFETYVIGKQLKELLHRYYGSELLEMLRTYYEELLDKETAEEPINNGSSSPISNNKNKEADLKLKLNKTCFEALQFFDEDGRGQLDTSYIEYILTSCSRSEKMSIGEIRHLVGLLPSEKKKGGGEIFVYRNMYNYESSS